MTFAIYLFKMRCSCLSTISYIWMLSLIVVFFLISVVAQNQHSISPYEIKWKKKEKFKFFIMVFCLKLLLLAFFQDSLQFRQMSHYLISRSINCNILQAHRRCVFDVPKRVLWETFDSAMIRTVSLSRWLLIKKYKYEMPN